MPVADSGFCLSEADAGALAEEPFTGLSVRLDVKGWLTEPVDGERVADFQVFMTPSSLADLLAQGRALQLKLAKRARLAAEAEAEVELLREGRAAFQEMADPHASRPDELMLCRLIKGLHALPDISLRRVHPKSPSVRRGGP